jgi:hypothetical protein
MEGISGFGSADMELCETLEAAVDVEETLEPVEKEKLALDESVRLDWLEARELRAEFDLERARASYEAFLVCDGAR